MRCVLQAVPGAPLRCVWREEAHPSKELPLWHFTSPMRCSFFDPSAQFTEAKHKMPQGPEQIHGPDREHWCKGPLASLPCFCFCTRGSILPLSSLSSEELLFLVSGSAQKSQGLLLFFFSLADKISISRRISPPHSPTPKLRT